MLLKTLLQKLGFKKSNPENGKGYVEHGIILKTNEATSPRSLLLLNKTSFPQKASKKIVM